jgi:hypothetical protein
MTAALALLRRPLDRNVPAKCESQESNRKSCGTGS